ncbi:hypothetical protein CXG81DRAFT_15848 [Caulochytrium protostelioides]|uniref:Alpha-1,3-glucosyltransferase n=1 Tax=Caulochytrium protostelioides TaxID=1555241 RepID=A0A4V1ITW7_9FUNG|nr:ALG6, ALG8 glycosyltransferase [Caulochytrium protostelioides]RKO98497.1 hypothetical protein CXG81DRAFT_15848 [Caulochytrium protostelioides]|eukprot:RKO98497.1 hypothetical protein CXG81DRAFT_15848 [Caulochytrium protostelioides]
MRLYRPLSVFQDAPWLGVVCVVAVTLLVRGFVGLGGYSGEHDAPWFGDFETQRHWLELTRHLPLREWYRYRFNWSPLDYPPVSAFHAYVFGRLADMIRPEWVALKASETFESPGLRLFMRSSALLTEYALLVPGIWAWTGFSSTSISPPDNIPVAESTRRLTAFAYLTAFPLLTLVDHGHFQYNAAMFGFTMWALVYWRRGAFVRGAIAFVCALCFKQMSLYYAIPVFCHLLTECTSIARRGAPGRALTTLLAIGAAVLATFGIFLAPFIMDEVRHRDPATSVVQAAVTSVGVIGRRVFPVARGLFEDKVANWWCVVNVAVKLKQRFSNVQLLRLSTVVTAAAVLPWHLLYLKAPARFTAFLYLLTLSALGFYLGSFLVHEKTIMLPAFPLLLLMPYEPTCAAWFHLVATWTNFFMLRLDHQILPYIAMNAAWVAITHDLMPWRHRHAVVRGLAKLSIAGMLGLHAFHYSYEAPARYLWFHQLLFACFGALQFSCFYVYLCARFVNLLFPALGAPVAKWLARWQ